MILTHGHSSARPEADGTPGPDWRKPPRAGLRARPSRGRLKLMFTQDSGCRADRLRKPGGAVCPSGDSAAKLAEIRKRRGLRATRRHPVGGQGRRWMSSHGRRCCRRRAFAARLRQRPRPDRGRLRSNVRNMIEATLGEELNGFLRCLRHRRDGGGREGMPPRALRHPGHGYAWHTETARSPGAGTGTALKRRWSAASD